jgi:prolyl oligopeptidase
VAWKKDNSGFYYTRHPKRRRTRRRRGLSRQGFLSPIGHRPRQGSAFVRRGRNPQDIPSVVLSEDGRWLLITVFQGWTKSELYLQDLASKNPPVEITTGKEFLYSGDFLNDKLYITTNEDAPRFRVFVADAINPKRENWKELIPQTDAVLQAASILGKKLFAQYEHNASSELKIFDVDGKKLNDIPLPRTVNAVGSKWDNNEVFFGFQSYTVPPSIYRLDLTPVDSKVTIVAKESKDNKNVNLVTFKLPELWAKVDAPSIDPSAFEVQQVWYNSKDGTRIPMFVVAKKGIEKNGKNPVLLTGYGGFNVSETPSFSRAMYLWTEHGGIYAVANLRGGAGFGEDWHRAGMLEKNRTYSTILFPPPNI